ncbi:hypothetical protein OIT44_03765 [Weissella ceti]|uniref:HeH/LEM domain-containing protein n=1 Tax=Weissella ceti TaxID=759620 RepID=A0ABT3E443_9LACO|nr:hypothetical protein [Weissella ceti]MCW0953190.1 hypothetical protein [Weissella ceti]QVK12708.1 hypothetical protein KHQ31_03530 [Weissella ceti]
MDKTIPTADNTVAEIKAYLDAQGIEYQDGMSKTKLLGLIPKQEEVAEEQKPVEEPPAKPTKPVRPITRYTKAHLVSSAKGAQKTWFIVALKDDETYTYQEALDAVLELKKGMFN